MGVGRPHARHAGGHKLSAFIGNPPNPLPIQTLRIAAASEIAAETVTSVNRVSTARTPQVHGALSGTYALQQWWSITSPGVERLPREIHRCGSPPDRIAAASPMIAIRLLPHGKPMPPKWPIKNGSKCSAARDDDQRFVSAWNLPHRSWTNRWKSIASRV